MEELCSECQFSLDDAVVKGLGPSLGIADYSVSAGTAETGCARSMCHVLSLPTAIIPAVPDVLPCFLRLPLLVHT